MGRGRQRNQGFFGGIVRGVLQLREAPKIPTFTIKLYGRSPSAHLKSRKLVPPINLRVLTRRVKHQGAEHRFPALTGSSPDGHRLRDHAIFPM